MLDQLQQFHFIRPLWFLMLIPLLACLWLLIREKTGGRSWEKICDSQLLPYVLIHTQGRKRKLSVSLFAIVGLITIIALAGPTWERLPQPVFRSGSALVIVLDLSRSMDAPDVAPSRLERARFKVIDILDLREEGETALIVYAGDAFTVTPLTSDTETIKSQLPVLTTSLMPLQGHRADLALEMATSILKQAGHPRGGIILITDEVDPERDVSKAEKLFSQGYRISVLGVGTEQGAPVNLPNGGFLKNKSGEIIIPMLDHEVLKKLATAGGGIYRSILPTNADIRALMGVIDLVPHRDGGSVTEFKSDIWQEQGPWLVLLLIPLVAMSFRRGVVLVLACLIAPLPQPAQAASWDGLWLNENQRAQRLLQQGKSGEAAKLFTDEKWKAAAEYRSGDFEKSLQTLEAAKDMESVYNKGNALARMGKFEEAVAAYEQVLGVFPDHEDAEYNLDLIKKEMEKQKQTSQQNSSGGGEDQQSGDEKGQPDEKSQDNSSREKQQDGNEPQDNQVAGQQDPENQGDQAVSKSEQDQQQGEDEREEQPGQPGEENNQEPQNADDMMTGNSEIDEESRATEQWLRRIPDDPGGLLREKFRLQYKQRGLSRHNYEQDW